MPASEAIKLPTHQGGRTMSAELITILAAATALGGSSLRKPGHFVPRCPASPTAWTPSPTA